MKDQEQLIKLLNRPGAHSGTVLGKALGISRVAVQKRIQSLIDNGLPVTAVPGKGYFLDNQVHLLIEDLIAESIIAETSNHVGRIKSLEVLQSTESTNNYLLERSIVTSGMRICASEAQHAGRGRRGNDWQSAPYRNVMLSVSWGFTHWPETITGLGLAVALSVAESLNHCYGLDVKIKWPNDLMVGNDKLAGILIDVAGVADEVCNVVIGLGLNVNQPDWSDKYHADYKWQDMHNLGVEPDRNDLIGKLVAGWLDMLIEFERSGFAPLAQRWNNLSSYEGKSIRVGENNSLIEGQMQGVDATGALLVKSKDGQIHRFADSNVRVRLVN